MPFRSKGKESQETVQIVVRWKTFCASQGFLHSPLRCNGRIKNPMSMSPKRASNLKNLLIEQFPIMERESPWSDGSGVNPLSPRSRLQHHVYSYRSHC